MQNYTKICFESRGLDPYMDTPMCDYCGMRPAVDVDHIDGRIGQLLTDPYNLALLCRECHMQHKTKEDKKILRKTVEYKIFIHITFSSSE